MKPTPEGSGPTCTVRELPSALHDDSLAQRLTSHRPAVFLDYDGVLTPIVDRPEDAVLPDSMRHTVRSLSHRCPVCVISGRDRAVVQRLMRIDDLVVAGSHGFDIWSPTTGTMSYPGQQRFHELISHATERIRGEVSSIGGVLIEPKQASVAVHYRLVDPADRGKVDAAVHAVLAEYPGQLKVMPGKMVYEIEPDID